MTIADSIRNILKYKNNIENNNNNNIDKKNETSSSIIPPNEGDDDNKNLTETAEEQPKKTSKYLGAFIHKPSNKLCRENVEKVLKEDPILHYIIKEMMSLGCLPPIIKCEPCDNSESYGSYSPYKGILICDNIQTFPLNIRNSVVHEYIHAYDICKNKFEPTNCEHIACTEIRAANLSGDCKWQMEALKKNYGVTGHQIECVKRRAIGSLKLNPLCKGVAEEMVNKVWSKCSEDFYPFSSIPRD
ncbi:hypothetical protein DICPUDRAFT_90652 [Dictyostelium purpureum]|uniref:Mitochondrial inner membrane protease ATP23 n=1 Tax=Dictyostelium purpureum TaxID=5786 RepID=F1A400_DICPU|nr:uncharacterized protein DICPUDRAFT_90652 [Dictyostelium purpureum]EGC29074.1 hypothetical protein DICPUDRAFT_90652 [Dictyostelium purpureum]|eukprot:XP_003294394.1 hypothetical protein DICPUDRAFT_90652 [Dictyostelium purpureum]